MITGRAALKIFFDESQRLYGIKEFKNFDDFMNGLKNSKERQYQILEASLTNAIEVLAQDSFFNWNTDSKVTDAMKQLAYLSEGKLPSLTGFTMAVSNEFSNLGLKDYGIIALKSVSDLVENVSNVGQGLLTTSKVLRYTIPVLVVGGLAFFIYSRTKRA